MKHTLTVKPIGKQGKFQYTVTDENGNYWCSRISPRTYVAVLISTEANSKGSGGYYCWFGRYDLIGKADSKKWMTFPNTKVVRLNELS